MTQELTRHGCVPHEFIYFKLYKSQIPIIEHAIETADMMPGSDESRGYCLEMICPDFLAGANLDSGHPMFCCILCHIAFVQIVATKSQ